MAQSFRVIDIRQKGIFPSVGYRFSTMKETRNNVVLERDFLGENPLHYYIDINAGELIVGHNIADLKDYLEKKERVFSWEWVRAVSNNTRVTVNNATFASASPLDEERGPTLEKYDPPTLSSDSIDYRNIADVGKKVRRLLDRSVAERMATIDDTHIGLLLSGGLDSMSIGYVLSQVREQERDQTRQKRIIAYTLKVDDDNPDVVRSRELAKRFYLDLTEVKVSEDETGITITLERYNPEREQQYTKRIAEGIVLENVVRESLKVSGNPKKDNMFCAVAMSLIGRAIQAEGITTVFCGEGPNEMINDYGLNPRDSGYGTEDKGDVHFREALTFGVKKLDRELGRGGLAKHATARMGKMFAQYGIRLESPYFTREIARVMTRIPHITSYDTIKQHLVHAMFVGEDLDGFIEGTTKEKFQDGSGITRLLQNYDQQRLVDMFAEIYGIYKSGYLR
ncbi:asparagine synthase [Candidatus Woesearchaeota archaeon]|nr:asparagine synthase [Candidatus Woesearchaeota archaeon]